MKKFKFYGLFSAIALVASICLSVLFKFSLSNTWQAMVALLFIFGPLWIYGWNKTGTLKTKQPFLFIFCRFCLINVVIGWVLSVILLFVGA